MKKVVLLLQVLVLFVSAIATAAPAPAPESESPLTAALKPVTLGQMTIEVPENAVPETQGTSVGYKLDEMGMAQVIISATDVATAPEEEIVKYGYSPNMTDDELLEAMAKTVTTPSESDGSNTIEFDEPVFIDVAGRKAIKVISKPDQMAHISCFVIAKDGTIHMLTFLFVTFGSPDAAATLDMFENRILSTVTFDDSLPMPQYVAPEPGATEDVAVVGDETASAPKIGMDTMFVYYDGYQVTMTDGAINEWGQLSLDVTVENNADRALGLSVDDVYINGWLVSGSSIQDVLPGKKSKDHIIIHQLENADVKTIDDINEIEFVARVYDPALYETVFETERQRITLD